MNKKAMYNLSYGLFVLTAHQDGKDNGCIINTAGQVTSTPNRISIAVNKQNLTHDMIKATGKFNVSIISQAAEYELFQHFGFQSGRNVDKLDGWVYAQRAANGVVYLTKGVNSYISATVEQAIDLGSHTLFIAELEDAEVLSGEPSCTYGYYQSDIKPKPQAQKKTTWVCTVCGYVYEGEELPDDFVCPLCKHGKEDFQKVQA